MLCISLTKYICLTQNQTNFSAANQTQEKKTEKKKKTTARLEKTEGFTYIGFG